MVLWFRNWMPAPRVILEVTRALNGSASIHISVDDVMVVRTIGIEVAQSLACLHFSSEAICNSLRRKPDCRRAPRWIPLELALSVVRDFETGGGLNQERVWRIMVDVTRLVCGEATDGFGWSCV